MFKVRKILWKVRYSWNQVYNNGNTSHHSCNHINKRALFIKSHTFNSFNLSSNTKDHVPPQQQQQQQANEDQLKERFASTAKTLIDYLYDRYIEDSQIQQQQQQQQQQSSPSSKKSTISNMSRFYKNFPRDLALTLQSTSDNHRRLQQMITYDDILKVQPNLVINFYNEKLNNFFSNEKSRILSPIILSKYLRFLIIHKRFEEAARVLTDHLVINSRQPDSYVLDDSALFDNGDTPARAKGNVSLPELDSYVCNMYDVLDGWYSQQRHGKDTNTTGKVSMATANPSFDYLVFLQHVYSSLANLEDQHNLHVVFKQILKSLLVNIKYKNSSAPIEFSFISEAQKQTVSIDEQIDILLQSFKFNDRLSRALRFLISQTEQGKDDTTLVTRYDKFSRALLVNIYTLSNLEEYRKILDEHEGGGINWIVQLLLYNPSDARLLGATSISTQARTLPIFVKLNILRDYVKMGQVDLLIKFFQKFLKRLNSLNSTLAQAKQQQQQHHHHHHHHHHHKKISNANSSLAVNILHHGSAFQYLFNYETHPQLDYDKYLELYRNFNQIVKKVTSITTQHNQQLDSKRVMELTNIAKLLKFNQSDFHFLIKEAQTFSDLKKLISMWIKQKYFTISSIDNLVSFRKNEKALSLLSYDYIFSRFITFLNTEFKVHPDKRDEKLFNTFSHYFKIVLANFYNDHGRYKYQTTTTTTTSPSNDLSKQVSQNLAHISVLITQIGFIRKASFTTFLPDKPELASFNAKVLRKSLRGLLQSLEKNNTLPIMQDRTLFRFFKDINDKMDSFNRLDVAFLRMMTLHFHFNWCRSETRLPLPYNIAQILQLSKWDFTKHEARMQLVRFVCTCVNLMDNSNSNSDANKQKIELLKTAYAKIVSAHAKEAATLLELRTLAKAIANLNTSIDYLQLLQHVENLEYYDYFKEGLMNNLIDEGKLGISDKPKWIMQVDHVDGTGNDGFAAKLFDLKLATAHMRYLAKTNIEESVKFHDDYIASIAKLVPATALNPELDSTTASEFEFQALSEPATKQQQNHTPESPANTPDIAAENAQSLLNKAKTNLLEAMLHGLIMDHRTLTQAKVNLACQLVTTLRFEYKHHIKYKIMQLFISNYLQMVDKKQSGSYRAFYWLFKVYQRDVSLAGVGGSGGGEENGGIDKFAARVQQKLNGWRVRKVGFWSFENLRRSDTLLRKYYYD